MKLIVDLLLSLIPFHIKLFHEEIVSINYKAFLSIYSDSLKCCIWNGDNIKIPLELYFTQDYQERVDPSVVDVHSGKVPQMLCCNRVSPGEDQPHSDKELGLERELGSQPEHQISNW